MAKKKVNSLYPYKTKSDVVLTKTVYLNGKKLSGVQAINLDYDINKVVTQVHVTMVAKRDSIKVTDDAISFNEVNFRD